MRARTRGVAGLVVVLVSAMSISAVVLPSSAQPAPSSAPPGSLLVALPALGQVNAILPSGLTQVLARGLSNPVAVAVLADATVVVAENGANRVSAFGGRFGVEPQAIVDLPAPTGLVAAPDGSVYVTAAGQVGRIDLAARSYQSVAGGFDAPIGPALADDVLYVPDLTAGRVTRIDVTSGVDLGPAVAGLAGPGGAATASGLPLFVTETLGAGVVRIDPGGVATPFATVPGALQVAFEPADPSPGGAWTLIVTTRDGLTRVTPNGDVKGERTSLPGVAGAVVTPVFDASDPSADPTGAGESTVLKDEKDGDSNSALLLIAGLVAAGVLALVGATIWFARRASRHEREDDGFTPSRREPAEHEAGGLAPVFGGCAQEEMAVDRLQEVLRRVTTQLDEAQMRRRRSSELASTARNRAMRALEVRTSVRNARLAAQPLPDRDRLSWARLSFATTEGREAFEAFRRREIGGGQLEMRLAALGETNVIAQIRNEGQRRLRADPSVPWPEERDAVRDAIAARDELRVHERDAEQAAAEEDQLAARRGELTDELASARARLDDCRKRTSASGSGEFGGF